MPLGHEQKKKRRFKYAPLGILLLVALIGFSLAKEFIRSYQIHSEIEALQQQIVALETQNRQTSDFVEYLKTDSYFDQQARIKLGLKAPGEKVIVINDQFKKTNVPDDALDGAMALQTFQRDGRSNPLKWFAYFFGDE